MSSGSASSSGGKLAKSPISCFRWCMVRYFSRPLPTTQQLTRSVGDGSAFLIVVYSARYGYRHLARARSTLNLLDRILEDTTIYFFAIVTWHLLVIFFELFASVSDRLAYLCSSADHEPHTGGNPTSTRQVSHRLRYCSQDKLDGVLYRF